MTVNLEKYKDEMLDAWKEVVEDKSPNDWVLYTYAGQTYDLKVASKGDGGIDELAEDLNSSKIMYAFCRVNDPKTSLPKNVLINWQGESAPAIRKGTCANHLSAIQKFFKGIHVTINARTEEEVDEESIIDKVSKSSGSSYNFNRSLSKDDNNRSKPVGAVYQRVNASKEIDAKARDCFWAQEEEEEKKRQLSEQQRKEEERKKRDEELKKRELEGSRARDNQVLERVRNITQLRQAEAKTSNHSVVETEKAKWAMQRKEDETNDEERRMRSENLRRQRANEAQSLIKQRSVDPRAIFEQNSAAGQLSSRRNSNSNTASSASPTDTVDNKWSGVASPAPTSPTPPVTTTFHSNHSNAVESSIPPSNIVAPAADFADNVPELPTSAPPTFDSALIEKAEEKVEDENQDWGASDQVEDYSDQINHSNFIESNGHSFGVRARALYDYTAGEAGEISFDPGDLITHIDQIDPGWWQGLGPDGNYGLFPANYVELIEN